MTIIGGTALYGCLWLSFGTGHSLLASASGRRILARAAGRSDRLLYNLIALAHLVLVLGIGSFLFGTEPPFVLARPLHVAMLLVSVAGAVIVLAAGRSYDLRRFLGISQWRAGIADAAIVPEPLAMGGMNAIIRHPLYLGLLLLIWGLAVTPFRLATATFATIYIGIGIVFEERKLMRLYGDDYARYRRKVPALLPKRLP
jgi:protein-S-isoprenylcysteine O-methyltransferase Ste14